MKIPTRQPRSCHCLTSQFAVEKRTATKFRRRQEMDHCLKKE
jgi:hypothetical protein